MVVGVDGNKRAELERVEDRLLLGNPKKKKFFFFGISLDLDNFLTLKNEN